MVASSGSILSRENSIHSILHEGISSKMLQERVPFKLFILLLSFIIILICLYSLNTSPVVTVVLNKLHPTYLQYPIENRSSIEILRQNGHLSSKKLPYPQSEILPAFVDYYENYRIAPKYNLATCQIQKILSTFRAGMFCLLYNQTAFLNQTNTISEQENCGVENERWELEELKKELKPGFLNFMVHREPIERFLSGYIDKCVQYGYRGFCYDCHNNLTCFIETQYTRFQGYLNGSLVDKDFLHGFEDRHFAPQTWYCRLNETFDDYRMVKYRSGKELPEMSDEILRILEEANVEDSLRYIIRGEMLKGSTYHTTRDSKVRVNVAKELWSNPHLIDLVKKMYYYDFIIFGYDIPETPKI